MVKSKIKEVKEQKEKREEIDPDHFTVFNFKEGWEEEMLKVWTHEELDLFKKRQELLRTIPVATRRRTKADKSYREGWVDATTWIHQEMKKIFHSVEEKTPQNL